MGDPARFEPTLREGDLAVIGFHGIEEPTAATVMLLSKGEAQDTALYSALATGLVKGSKPIRAYGRVELLNILDSLALPANHPARRLTTDPNEERDLEEAARGVEAAVERVRKRRVGKPMSAAELAAWRAKGEENGKLGEALVDAYFKRYPPEDGAATHAWVSKEKASHPYDFEIVKGGVAIGVVDAKSTSGAWEADFFMSGAEVEHAARSAVPYVIHRVSEVSATGAWLRKSDDIRPLARKVLDALRGTQMPGVRATNFSISPNTSGLSWSGRIRIVPEGAPVDAPTEAELKADEAT